MKNKEIQMIRKKLRNGDLIHPVCPNCGCSLLCYKKTIDGEASLKLIAVPKNQKWGKN